MYPINYRKKSYKVWILGAIFVLQLIVVVKLYTIPVHQIKNAPMTNTLLFHARKNASIGKPNLNVGSVAPETELFEEYGPTSTPYKSKSVTTIIVFTHEASTCPFQQTAINFSKLKAKYSRLRVALITPLKYDDAFLAQCRMSSKGVEIMRDPNRKTAKRFCAWWTPRIYVVNKIGKIEYVQSAALTQTEAIEEVDRQINVKNLEVR